MSPQPDWTAFEQQGLLLPSPGRDEAEHKTLEAIAERKQAAREAMLAKMKRTKRK